MDGAIIRLGAGLDIRAGRPHRRCTPSSRDDSFAFERTGLSSRDQITTRDVHPPCRAPVMLHVTVVILVLDHKNVFTA